MRQPVRGRGRTTKHATASKHTHGASAKHHPTKTAAAATHHQKFSKILVVTVGPHGKVSVRTAPLGAGLPCCAAEAVHQVSGVATLELFRRTDGPATIPATLEAAGMGYAPVDLRGLQVFRAGLILGLALPEGPHAVTVAGDGCWLSWGAHYDPGEFPGAVVEEAWEVTWPPC